MKLRIIAWILVLILALTPMLSVAEGDDTEPPASADPSTPPETDPPVTPDADPTTPQGTDPPATPGSDPTTPPETNPPASPTEQPSASPTAEASPSASADPTASPAAPTSTPGPVTETADPLKIDTYWKYPGMEKSYAQGYMPVQSGKTVRFLMPLLGKTLGSTIRVVPEFPSDGPFAASNLQFDVSEKTYDVTQGQNSNQKEAYLVQFSAPLKDTYYNGTYTVMLHVSYKNPQGEPAEQTFPMQIQITGGKTVSAGGGGGGMTVVRKPVILIDNYAIDPLEVSGGEKVSVKISLTNVGNYDARNIRVSLVPESDTLKLEGDLNARFFDALLVRGKLEAAFDLSVQKGASEGPALFTVQLAYEDRFGGSYTDEGKYQVYITQPKIEILSCEYSEVVNGGDGFTVMLTVQNTGTRDAKNVSVQYTGSDDSIRNKDAKDHQEIGTLKVGESRELVFNLRAMPNAMEGKHSFRFSCFYQEADSGGSYESSGNYPLSVVQEASLGYDQIKLPESVTCGESFTLPVCVYNTGFSEIFNIRCTLDCDGLICSSAFLGNLAPQESADKTMTVFVTTLSGTQKYGDTYGSVQIFYEDVNGERHTEFQSVKMTVAEPVKVTDEEKAKKEKEQKEQQTLSQWWISLLVAIAVIIILIAVIVIARFVRMMRLK